MQTTTFISDANVVTADLIKPKRYKSLLYKSDQDNTHQSILDFFRKPYPVQSGTLSTTDTVTSFAAINLPMDFLLNNIYLQKTIGYLGFRGDMVVKLEINGNRFQQGRYMLCYIPTGGASTSLIPSNQINITSHYATLVQRTQLKRIELDVNCDTTGTFTIPFDSCMNYFPISSLSSGSRYGQTGYLRLFPYSTMVSPTGGLTAGYTIWISYENVELISAAGPQMGRVSKGMTPAEKEATQANIGPVSSALQAASSSLNALSAIPLLSDYAQQSSWVLDRMANVASVFGYSKPLNQQPAHFVKRIVADGIGKVDYTSDNSIKLSSSNNNQVEMLAGFASTDVDEMDFSYLMTIPAYVGSATWTVGTAAQTALTWSEGFVVSPQAQLLTTTTNAVAQVHYTPLQFISTRFRYWRGSLVYTLKFVKTEFHSGRLMICFFPNTPEDASNINSFANANYTHRMIVDIRECNEVTFRVPFVSNKPWKNTSTLYQDYNCGQILGYILDPLVAPSSVGTSITILAEMSAGQDMEFAVPLSNPGQGSSNTIQSTFLGVVPQMGLPDPSPESDVCKLVSMDLGISEVTPDATISSSACIGEKISSFRSLIKNYEQITCTVAQGASNKFLNIIPFGISSQWYNGTINVTPNNSPDLYSILAQCYLYSRGGVRIKVYNNYTQAVATSVTQNQFPVTYIQQFPVGQSSIVSTTTNDISGNSIGFQGIISGQKIFHHTTQNGFSEFEVPQYHQYHSRVNSEHYCCNNSSLAYKSTLGGDDTVNTAFGVSQYIGSKNNYDTNVMIFRAGAEDCNFGGFISIPPISYISTSAWVAQ